MIGFLGLGLALSFLHLPAPSQSNQTKQQFLKPQQTICLMWEWLLKYHPCEAFIVMATITNMLTVHGFNNKSSHLVWVMIRLWIELK